MIRRLLEGFDDASDGGASLQTPADVMRQVGRCRLVITGSYHAGVFALSQGVPVIGLAKSDYYVAKFEGLADQFGCGCDTVPLNQTALKQDLLDKTSRLWKAAGALRPRLLQAAEKQIAQGQQAYERLRDLVEARPGREKVRLRRNNRGGQGYAC